MISGVGSVVNMADILKNQRELQVLTNEQVLFQVSFLALEHAVARALDMIDHGRAGGLRVL